MTTNNPFFRVGWQTTEVKSHNFSDGCFYNLFSTILHYRKCTTNILNEIDARPSDMVHRILLNGANMKIVEAPGPLGEFDLVYGNMSHNLKRLYNGDFDTFNSGFIVNEDKLDVFTYSTVYAYNTATMIFYWNGTRHNFYTIMAGINYEVYCLSLVLLFTLLMLLAVSQFIHNDVSWKNFWRFG